MAATRWCVVIALVGIAACSVSRGAPTPVPDAPTITCPAAPDPVNSLDGAALAVSFPAPVVSGGQSPLNTSCVPVSGSSFPIGTNTVTCTTSDARARTASCTFAVVVLPPPKLSVTSFLAFGDSITWGEDGTSAAAAPSGQRVFVQLSGLTYPDVLQQDLHSRYQQQQTTVKNAGCPGEELSQPGEFNDKCFGERRDDTSAYRRMATLASVHGWDVVLLMEGSNDVNSAAKDSTVLPLALDYLRKMVDVAKANGMKVILGTLPPMVPPGLPGRTDGWAIVPTYNDSVRALAASEGVPLADVYQAFGSDASTLIGFDGLHPNAAGYRRIADTFFGAIKSSFETQPSAARTSRVKR
jgi:lysophospholipase L1-like esterase